MFFLYLDLLWLSLRPPTSSTFRANFSQGSTSYASRRTHVNIWVYEILRTCVNVVYCNVEFAILCSKKEFCKNSSLITRNVVSCCNVGCYSVDSPYTTRHPTHHPKPCILLRMWILRIRFALALLVTLKKVTSDLSFQLILYQYDMQF